MNFIDFAQALHAESIEGETCSLTRSSLRLTGRAVRGSKGALLGARLSIELGAHVTAAPILLRTERAVDRFGKAIGVNREFSAGDDAFDRQVYIEADVPDATLARVCRSTAFRLAVVDVLLACPDFALEVGPPGVLVFCVPLRRFKDAPLVERALERAPTLLHELREAVPPSAAGYRDPQTAALEAPLGNRFARGWAFAGYLLAFVALRVLLPAPPTFDASAGEIGALLGLAVTVAHFFVLGRLFGGRSTSLRTVACWMFACFPVFVFTGIQVAKWANATFDRGASHTERCTLSVRHPNKGSPYLEVKLADGSAAELDLPTSTASRNPTVTIRPGRFGARWVVAVHPTGTGATRS